MQQRRTTEQTEIHVGYSTHGQKAVLIGGRDSLGGWSWSLRLEARTWRDSPIQIDGLTTDLVKQMALAVEGDGR